MVYESEGYRADGGGGGAPVRERERQSTISSSIHTTQQSTLMMIFAEIILSTNALGARCRADS